MGDFMIVRLGYVSISKSIYDDTSFKSINYTNYMKNANLERIDSIIVNNLETLSKIICFNIRNNVHFYRITSDLVPLATLDDVSFDYIDKYSDYYKEIGNLINLHKMRVDAHPSEYTVLNSTNQKVVNDTFKILRYHVDILKSMNIDPFVILHVGSSVFGKKNSLTRFINNFNLLDSDIKSSILVENDDKVFNVSDVLYLCRVIKRPFVLDYLHHACNPCEKDITCYLKDIFDTWGDMTPKVHFSSSKSKLKKEMRSHADFVNVNEFISFIELIKLYTDRVDVMIEAKMKDEAMFRLIRQLKYLTDYTFIDDTTFIVK